MKTPNRSKSDEAFYKTCQATQDGTLLKEIDNKMKRSKELEEILTQLYEQGIEDGRFSEINKGELYNIAIVSQAIIAIEKWAKEKYAPKPIKDTEA